jgi:hypothetical protein
MAAMMLDKPVRAGAYPRSATFGAVLNILLRYLNHIHTVMNSVAEVRLLRLVGRRDPFHVWHHVDIVFSSIKGGARNDIVSIITSW